MAKQEQMVTMRKGDQTKEVPESEVSYWQARGWRKEVETTDEE